MTAASALLAAALAAAAPAPTPGPDGGPAAAAEAPLLERILSLCKDIDSASKAPAEMRARLNDLEAEVGKEVDESERPPFDKALKKASDSLERLEKKIPAAGGAAADAGPSDAPPPAPPDGSGRAGGIASYRAAERAGRDWSRPPQGPGPAGAIAAQSERARLEKILNSGDDSAAYGQAPEVAAAIDAALERADGRPTSSAALAFIAEAVDFLGRTGEPKYKDYLKALKRKFADPQWISEPGDGDHALRMRYTEIRHRIEIALDRLGEYDLSPEEKKSVMIGKDDRIKKAAKFLRDAAVESPGYQLFWEPGEGYTGLAGYRQQEDARLAVTGVVVEALEKLLAAKPARFGLGEEEIKSVKRHAQGGKAYIRFNSDWVPGKSWCGLRSFSQGYGLSTLASDPKGKEEAGKILSRMAASQKIDGSWGYGAQDPRSASFALAVEIIGMVDADGQGWLDRGQKAMLGRAAAALEAGRGQDGLFEYLVTRDPAVDPGFKTAQARAGTTVVCEYALFRYAQSRAQSDPKGLERQRRRLREAATRYHEHRRSELALLRADAGIPHSGASGQSTYYLLFHWHYYVLALKESDHPQAGAWLREAQLELLAPTPASDGAGRWMDYSPSGEAYGTAMALSTLLDAQD